MPTSTPKHGWPTHLGGTALICIVVGLLNYLMRGGSFGMAMLYAFTIGAQISLYISLLMAGVAHGLRRRYGDRPGLRHGWVGWGWAAPCVLLGALAGYLGGLWLGDLISGRHALRPWNMAEGRAGWAT